jgi:hypothetical protein
VMTAKTSNERQRELVARRRDAGLKEVRNLWVSPENEQAVRDYAEKLERRRASAIQKQGPRRSRSEPAKFKGERDGG